MLIPNRYSSKTKLYLFLTFSSLWKLNLCTASILKIFHPHFPICGPSTEPETKFKSSLHSEMKTTFTSLSLEQIKHHSSPKHLSRSFGTSSPRKSDPSRTSFPSATSWKTFTYLNYLMFPNAPGYCARCATCELQLKFFSFLFIICCDCVAWVRRLVEIWLLLYSPLCSFRK